MDLMNCRFGQPSALTDGAMMSGHLDSAKETDRGTQGNMRETRSTAVAVTEHCYKTCWKWIHFIVARQDDEISIKMFTGILL